MVTDGGPGDPVLLTEAPSETFQEEVATTTSSRAVAGGFLAPHRNDTALVNAMRRGDLRAFELIYSRHSPSLHAYCRHVLGCRHEAEDAVQQTFLNAFRAITADDRELKLRPWLYRIAHNQCISVIRRRRERIQEEVESPTLGLSAQVEHREELRATLRDMADLPEEQRAALVMSELKTFSHAEIADTLGCPPQRVKSLVFQARQSLASGREAREVSCDEIREQLAVLSGGSLRRSVLRRHLVGCRGCREFRRTMRQDRRAAASFAPGGISTEALLGAGVGGTAIATSVGGNAVPFLLTLKALIATGLVAIGSAAGVISPSVPSPRPDAAAPQAPVSSMGPTSSRLSHRPFRGWASPSGAAASSALPGVDAIPDQQQLPGGGRAPGASSDPSSAAPNQTLNGTVKDQLSPLSRVTDSVEVAVSGGGASGSSGTSQQQTTSSDTSPSSGSTAQRSSSSANSSTGAVGT
jgi:RNA polymerase sigma factor (sigma-70 family)